MTTTSTNPIYTNIHGRRPGRGIRPWLLVPKILAVGMYVGGLAAATFVWIGGDYTSIPVDDPRRQWLLDLVGRVMVYFVIPSLLVAIFFGILLLLQFPRIFLRMRWLQIKLVLLMILIPAGHFWCRGQTLILRDTAASIDAQSRAARALSTGLVATLGGSLIVVAIGRLKPRFGQNPARILIKEDPLATTA